MRHLHLLLALAACGQCMAVEPVVVEMLDLNNSLREEAYKDPQTLDARLCAAAQDQAEYLVRTGQFSHHVNGTPRTRAAKYGFPVRDFTSLEVRENIGGDFSNAENAFHAWRNTSHYENIIADCKLCGFGMVDGRKLGRGNIWVAVYGNETVGPTQASQPVLYQQPVYRQQSCSGPNCGQSTGRRFFFRGR